MIFLHVEPYKETLIRHWANEIENEDDPLYEIPTYQIHKLNTDEYYDEAIDLPNEERERRGLIPFFYEETNIPVEKPESEEDEEENQLIGE